MDYSPREQDSESSKILNHNLSGKESEDIIADEIIRLLLREFGIYWEPKKNYSVKRHHVLADSEEACKLLRKGVIGAYAKHYSFISRACFTFWGNKVFTATSDGKTICNWLRSTCKMLNGLQMDKYKFFVIMAAFGNFCVLVCRSGLEMSVIPNAALAFKCFILETSMADFTKLSSIAHTFCDK